MPLCWCVDHAVEYITFYVQKHKAHLVSWSGTPLVRHGPLGAPVFVKLAYSPRQDTAKEDIFLGVSLIYLLLLFLLLLLLFLL